jgi:hypothetical protein
MFALEDSGYIYNWEYIRLGLVEGLKKEKKQISVFILNFKVSDFLNPT